MIFFMIIGVSYLSHIIGFLAVYEYNMDFAIQMDSMGEGSLHSYGRVNRHVKFPWREW